MSLISIGSNTIIGSRCVLETVRHSLDYVERRSADGVGKPITIWEDCWLGASVTVLGGVTIGRRSIVAAGAVVIRDVEDGTLVGGVPAKLIRRLEIGDEEIREQQDSAGNLYEALVGGSEVEAQKPDGIRGDLQADPVDKVDEKKISPCCIYCDGDQFIRDMQEPRSLDSHNSDSDPYQKDSSAASVGMQPKDAAIGVN